MGKQENKATDFWPRCFTLCSIIITMTNTWKQSFFFFFLNHKNSTMQQVVFRDSSSTAIQLSTASLCLSRTCLTRKKKDTLLLSPFSINLGEAGEPGRSWDCWLLGNSSHIGLHGGRAICRARHFEFSWLQSVIYYVIYARGCARNAFWWLFAMLRKGGGKIEGQSEQSILCFTKMKAFSAQSWEGGIGIGLPSYANC